MIDATVYKNVLAPSRPASRSSPPWTTTARSPALPPALFVPVHGPAAGAVLPQLQPDSYPVLIKQKRFAIHLLSGEQQAEAYAFAKKGKDKAAGIEWRLSELGNPLLANATAIIECELWREYEGGDHAIMVGKVHNLIVPEEAPRPMVYCRGKMASLPAFA